VIQRMSDETEIVIVGAGVAGLSAAQTLAAAGIPFTLVEASHRIGGRAYSEAFTSGAWFDLGCSYLHEGVLNPFTPIAAKLGFGLGDGTRFARDNWHVKTDRGRLTGPARAQQLAYWDATDRTISAFESDRDDDLALADLMNWDPPQAAAYAHLMAGLNGCDVSEQSAIDFTNAGFGLDYPVIGGLGQLVQRWGGGVPVTLNCMVKGVEWSSDRVALETTRGRITARRASITVSTGILQSGRIAFTPELPDRLGEAINCLPCGTLNKIGILLAENCIDPELAGWHLYMPVAGDSDQLGGGIAGVDINLDDGPQAIVFVGCSLGVYLERLGPAAMQAYAEDCLVSLFGSRIRAVVRDCKTTAWSGEPLSLGAYSHAVPGGVFARRRLAEPLADTVFFAGEAVSDTHFATCHGAFLSGQATARRVLDSLT